MTRKTSKALDDDVGASDHTAVMADVVAPTLLPWQEGVWMRLVERRSSLPHALLLHGPQFIGKQLLASLFSSSLLCLAPDARGLACGQCRACGLMAAQSHPDLRWVVPEADDPSAADESERSSARSRKPSRDIRIEQIRSLQGWLSVGAHQGGWKIAVIVPAEAMNTATANALLKTLEEPPPRSLLLLVSHRPSLLLPTVLSRCQRVGCSVPERAVALEWLARQGVADAADRLDLVGGAPLRALEADALRALAGEIARIAADPELDAVQASARLAGQPMPLVIDLLQKWVFDLLTVRAGLEPRYYLAHAALVGRVAGGIDLDRTFALERALSAARALAEHPLNPRLVMEDLLLQLRASNRALS